jgi:outer membrane protein assembly factor BamA
LIRPLRAALTALLTALAATLASGAQAAPPATAPTAQQETPGSKAILAGEDPSIGGTVPDLGDAPPRDLVGKPIVRIDVVTAGGRWVAPLTLTKVRPGEAASPEAARRLMGEVLETGRFARANVEAFAEGDGVVLRLNVLPRRLVATLKVRGGALDDAETLEAAGVAVGGELTAPQLDDIAARLRRFYDRHGYPAADVQADATDTDEPGKVFLSVVITPGKPRTVTSVVYVFDSPVSEREVGGLKSGYRVSAGARVDEPVLSDADHELTESLRQHGFVRAAVTHAVKDVGAYSYLYVFLKPSSRLVPSFDGQHAFDAGDLEQALNLEKAPEERSGELIDRLRAFYVTRGFPDAEVSMVETGKPSDAVRYLAFTIREHRQVRVSKPVFPCLDPKGLDPDVVSREIGSFLEEELPGGDTFSPPDPRVIERTFGPTQGTGGRGVPTPLNPLLTYAPETYERALKHLRDLLHSKGYLNAVVGPMSAVRATCDRRSRTDACVPLPPRVPIVERCLKDSLGLPLPEPTVPESASCKPDPAHDVECSPEISLRIPIALGPQTVLYDLAFDGNKSLSGAELARVAALPLGSPISSVELEAARGRVLDAYRLRGYAYADVRTQAEPSPDRTRARIRFYVTERAEVTVTGFVVKGAARTSESLILGRVALKLGAPFRQDWVRLTEERIATLGTFSSVTVSLENGDVPERRKRVIITVVEVLPQFFESRPGFSTGDGLRFSFEWAHRNLGGLAISVGLRVQFSYLPDGLILDPQVRANYDANLSNILLRLERRDTLSFTFPEIGLGPLVSLSLDAIDLNDNQRDYGIMKEAIVPTVAYRPFRQLNAQLGVSAEYNFVKIFNDAAQNATLSTLRAPEGKTVALAQRGSLTVDYRDKPLNATRGGFASASIEHVDAFPAGTDATEKSHFFRFTGRVAGYIPLPAGIRIAASVGVGYNLQLTSKSKTYPDRLFFLGGVDSVRAFLADTVVPQDVSDRILAASRTVLSPQSGLPVGQRGKPFTIDDVALRGGDAVISPRLELRVPVTGIFEAVAFLDTGNVWADPGNISLQLRYAAGAGILIDTPIGPLALNYGINLQRRAWLQEDFGAFHFSIGVF